MWWCVFVTCNGRQGSGVGIGQQHISVVWLRQVGVTAELLLLRQLEGARDHTKLSNNISKDTQRHVTHCPPCHFISSHAPRTPHSHPFAVQRARPLSLLCDEDHAAPLLLLLTLPQFDLCVTHRHHPSLLCHAYAHAAAGARQGGSPGVWGFGGDVPEEEVGSKEMKGLNVDFHVCVALE